MTITISTSNSSRLPLASGAVFVGVGENVTQYSSIRIAVQGNAAVAGTLYAGFSSDNATWTETMISVANPVNQLPITVKITGIYFRLRYANGASAQTTFRIQATYSGADIAAGSGIAAGAATVNFVKQVIPLTSLNISSKSVTIANQPANSSAVSLTPEGGLPQRFGVDYTVSGTTVSWNGLGLDNFLDASDVLELTYFT